jgi:hypothetical protein
MAVGSSAASASGPSRTLAEAWNGTSWRILTTINPSGTAASSLASVSCTSAARCIAVGDDGTRALAEAWNGTGWRILKTPALASSSLASVSCTSAARCVAVGDHGARTLAEAWNGTSWRRIKTRTPAGTSVSSLTSVSCASFARCMAVGYAAAVNYLRGQLPLAEAWNGTSWRILPVPSPLPGQINSFWSVSCTHGFSCLAVGGSEVNQGAGPLPSFAEAWNGTWRLVKAANPRTGRRLLTGVSCPRANRCLAIGNSTGIEVTKGSGPYAEEWNGASWRLLKVPGPRSVAYDGLGLTGVSCAKTSSCIATGGFFTNPGVNSRSRTIAEAWNGTKWRELRPLNP